MKKFGSSREAKVEGYFSRKHRTREGRAEAMAAHEENRPTRPRQVWEPETKTWKKIPVGV